MKRFVLLVLLAAAFFAPAAALAGNPWMDNAVVTVSAASDNVSSQAMKIPVNIKYIALEVPTLTSSTVTIHVSYDGTVYRALHSMDNGTNTILWSHAASTGDYFVVVPGRLDTFRYMKVVCGTAQAATRQIRVMGVTQ